MDWILWPVAFLLSAIEEALAARRTQAIVAKRAIRAANWSALFDLVLFVDFMLLIVAGWEMVLPICAGSWVGSWYSVHSQKEGE